jgi:hypothetical protein
MSSVAYVLGNEMHDFRSACCHNEREAKTAFFSGVFAPLVILCQSQAVLGSVLPLNSSNEPCIEGDVPSPFEGSRLDLSPCGCISHKTQRDGTQLPGHAPPGDTRYHKSHGPACAA